MHIKKYLLCSSLCLIANTLYAGGCPSGYTCSAITFDTCLTATGTSCSGSTGESPVIAYFSGWDNPFGGTINFNTIPASGVTSDQTVNVTLGTLDDPSASPTGLTITSASAAGQTANNYDIICSDNGTCGASAGKIPYTVQYKACDGTTKYISPNGSPLTPAEYSISTVSMAGANPACKPESGGGSGQLIFNIVPAGSGEYAGGSYTGTFCMTVCTESAACTVSSCT